MESESLVMVRCPECGGLMVEGMECRVCTGAAAFGAPPPTVGGGAPAQRRIPVAAMVLVIVLVLLLVGGAAAVVLAGEPEPAIEGWHKVQGRGLSLLLPEGWSGGAPGSELMDEVLVALRGFGPSYEVLVEAIESNPDAVLLFAVDQALAGDGFATNVNAVAEKPRGDVSLDEYVEAALGMLPPSFQVRESTVTRVGPHQAARLTTDFTLPTGGGRQVAYIFKKGSTFWAVTYTTSAAQYDARLADFERSAATIRFD